MDVPPHPTPSRSGLGRLITSAGPRCSGLPVTIAHIHRHPGPPPSPRPHAARQKMLFAGWRPPAFVLRKGQWPALCQGPDPGAGALKAGLAGDSSFFLLSRFKGMRGVGWGGMRWARAKGSSPCGAVPSPVVPSPLNVLMSTGASQDTTVRRWPGRGASPGEQQGNICCGRNSSPALPLSPRQGEKGEGSRVAAARSRRPSEQTALLGTLHMSQASAFPATKPHLMGINRRVPSMPKQHPAAGCRKRGLIHCRLADRGNNCQALLL